MGLTWEVATDAAEVHALLEDSDAEQAVRYQLPAPQRNPATTASRVAAGQVHLMRIDGRAVGSFTLSGQPPFELTPGIFPEVGKPLYLSRLSVAADQLRGGSLVGLNCLRQAIAAARRAGADALRSQANPDFADTLAMLELHGFRQCGQAGAHGPLRVVNMQRTFTG